jgi:hypothetical protein
VNLFPTVSSHKVRFTEYGFLTIQFSAGKSGISAVLEFHRHAFVIHCQHRRRHGFVTGASVNVNNSAARLDLVDGGPEFHIFNNALLSIEVQIIIPAYALVFT